MTASLRYTELPALADHESGFEAVWVSTSDRNGTYRVLPDGRCDIILRFDARLTPLKAITVVVTGPTTRFYDVALEPGMGFVGIRMRPGFFERILGFAPATLADDNLVGDDAFAALPVLKDLCSPALNHAELAARLTAFVRQRSIGSRLEPAPISASVISAFHAAGGRLRVGDVAAMHKISERTVQRIFLKAIGLKPKAFAAILQFHRALRLLRDHRLSPTEAALEAGYADQAHMNRAFRRMGGFSPARLPDVTLVTLGE
ncbi:helix-turn-helix transcriptional regulator [Ensifer sp. HO-A22]|uniref:Helix-turn-helix transcriptional regulator n=1 Tax=Ensifer oleiphilus TaxID=2742698 RepID=A0A7Y6QAU4_9HYPH|nr:helix-turn-helix transcriptional regulator [Ensifer oleiphilus]NVD42229.1 helix-turn-helix transcriptional regulator [Ensifer oleiphilus]